MFMVLSSCALEALRDALYKYTTTTTTTTTWRSHCEGSPQFI